MFKLIKTIYLYIKNIYLYIVAKQLNNILLYVLVECRNSKINANRKYITNIKINTETR